MDIALKGHRDDSKYHPDVGEPSGHSGLGNSVEPNDISRKYNFRGTLKSLQQGLT